MVTKLTAIFEMICSMRFIFNSKRRKIDLVVGLVGLTILSAHSAERPPTGPETEKRFPPLQVPEGFQATLFACDPFIEYPSVIALGPHLGSVFLAHDYMTGLGTEIVRRDEIRLIEDTDQDGYADKSTVYAGGFNSIQGLSYHSGTVYAMHSPYLTALRDLNGDGVADERHDLLTGLGLPPEDNPLRLHCANGVTVGHDGWLYLALGDHGSDVLRPEGDRLLLEEGGILRCRPDGYDLHVFATGLRNIYDVALDEELNVFVRDNENDGGDYKNRVYHSFFGADHGYPYLYYERPQEALAPLADLGLGSSAGGVCYLEPAFPPDYRGSLFFCEWGRSVVRYRRDRAGSSFRPMREYEFAAGDQADPYGFKPTDATVDYDGSLLVSDWADGQRPKRGRGRIYRISYRGKGRDKTSGNNPGSTIKLKQPSDRRRSASRRLTEGERGAKNQLITDWIIQLNSPGYQARVAAQLALEDLGADGLRALLPALHAGKVGVLGRLHACWIIARMGILSSIEELFRMAETDPDPRVRAQSIRAIADLTDPIFITHRLDAGRGDSQIAERLAALPIGQDRRVNLEIIIALGRLRWEGAPDWLRKNFKKSDTVLAHAAMQTLLRCQNWPAVLQLLDQPNTAPTRVIARWAVSDQAVPVIVDGLIKRLRAEIRTRQRREYADALTRVYKQPKPWVYWGYRPAPRPANTLTWERTEAIEQALDEALAYADRTVHLPTLLRMQREKIPARLPTLAQWLKTEREEVAVAAILNSLQDHPAKTIRNSLEQAVREPGHATKNRLAALQLFVTGLDSTSRVQLLALANSLEDGPVLAELLRQLGQQTLLRSDALLLGKLRAPAPEVRAAAISSLAELNEDSAAASALMLLSDPVLQVRRAAAAATGTLQVRAAVEPLLKLAADQDAILRRESIKALRRLGESRAVPLAVAALKQPETQIAALRYLAELGGVQHVEAVTTVADENPSLDILTEAMKSITRWRRKSPANSRNRLLLENTLADLQGRHGLLLNWRIAEPLSSESAAALVNEVSQLKPTPDNVPGGALASWLEVVAVGAESRVKFVSDKESTQDSVWLGYTDVAVTNQAEVQFLAASSGTLRVWLNGKSVYDRQKPGPYRPESDRFNGLLREGRNRLVVRVSGAQSPQFHLRIRYQSSKAEHERLVQQTLRTQGNVLRGKEIFINTEKSQCLKCHRLGALGGQIGPNLTGVGSRFSRIHLIESILEPSRTMAPSYQSVTVYMKDGRVVSGVRIAETDTTITLGDNQGQQHMLKKSEIEDLQESVLSAMPEGLEKQLTQREFVDLIAFLLAQKK